MLVGNDVSQFQGQIDWNTYANNSNFVIIRATYGNGYLDKQFFRNRDESRRVRLPRGFYHYAYPQYNAPEAEADWFLSQMNLQKGESLFLDYEESWAGDKAAWCKAFLDRIASHLNGYKALIYLNQSLVASANWQPLVDAGYGLWLASYQADGVGNTGQWPFMAFQQTSSSQVVPGIAGAVDRDVFFGELDAFSSYGYMPPVQTPPNVPPPPQTPPTGDPTTPQVPPVPPSQPPPTTAVDYKPYLVNIKGDVNGKPPWWDFALHDPRIDQIKAEINQSGV